MTASGQFLGTVDYAAPEQLNGQPVDGRTDQYALGCSAFELLCGEPPFRRDRLGAAVQAHLTEPPPPATSRLPWLPSEVDRVFARVLAKAPADRYGTCQEFADQLRRALRLRSQAVDAESASPELAANVAPPERMTSTYEPTAPGDGLLPDVLHGAGLPSAAEHQASPTEPGPSPTARATTETPVPEEARKPMNKSNIPAPSGRELPWREKLEKLIAPLTAIIAAIMPLRQIPIGYKLGAAAAFVLFSAGIILLPKPPKAWWKTIWPKLKPIFFGAVAGVIVGFLIATLVSRPPHPTLTSTHPTCCAPTHRPSPKPPVSPPPSASVVTTLITKEAAAAVAGRPADAIVLYAPTAFVSDAACLTHGQSRTWSGRDQILQRYLHLGAFSWLRHVDPEVTFTPNNALATSATATAQTAGFIKPSATLPTGLYIHGNERWTFIRVAGQWLIKSFTYNVCFPAPGGG